MTNSRKISKDICDNLSLDWALYSQDEDFPIISLVCEQDHADPGALTLGQQHVIPNVSGGLPWRDGTHIPTLFNTVVF